MMNLADRLANSGDYKYITLQRSWRTATGRVGTSGLIPDVIAVRKNGVVDAWEVMSDTDTRLELMNRLNDGMQSLPTKLQGNINVIKAEVP